MRVQGHEASIHPPWARSGEGRRLRRCALPGPRRAPLLPRLTCASRPPTSLKVEAWHGGRSLTGVGSSAQCSGQAAWHPMQREPPWCACHGGSCPPASHPPLDPWQAQLATHGQNNIAGGYQKCVQLPGVEPGSPRPQRGILTTKLQLPKMCLTCQYMKVGQASASHGCTSGLPHALRRAADPARPSPAAHAAKCAPI